MHAPLYLIYVYCYSFLTPSCIPAVSCRTCNMVDNITRVVAEGTMVMHILARVYKYRVNSSLRWTEEMVEDYINKMGKDTKERVRQALTDSKQGYCGGQKHLMKIKSKSTG